MKLRYIVITALLGAMVASTAIAASFEGSSLSIGALADYALKTATNLFTKDQLIDDPEVLTSGQFSGLRVQTTERASVCIGPSDGQSKEFCLSGGGALMLHGSNSDIYDGTSTGNITLISDPGLNRTWYSPSGSAVVAGGTGVPIETAFMVGSNQEGLATFSVDTTNDWIKLLPIGPPSGTLCNGPATLGRIYMDAADSAVKYCNGTAWKSLGGPTGTAIVQENFNEFSGATDGTWFTDSNVQFQYKVAGQDIEMNIITLPASPTTFIAASCTDAGAGNQQEANFNTTGVVDIFGGAGGTLANGKHVTCVISANTDTSYPSYYLNIYNTDNNITVLTKKVTN